MCSVGKFGALNVGYLHHVLGDLELGKYLSDQAFERDLLGKLVHGVKVKCRNGQASINYVSVSMQGMRGPCDGVYRIEYFPSGI